MSGILHKIEEKLGMGDEKHEEKQVQPHRPGYKPPEHVGGCAGHKQEEHNEGLLDKIKDKISGDHCEGEKKKKEKKKHEDGHDYGSSSSDSDSD